MGLEHYIDIITEWAVPLYAFTFIMSVLTIDKYIRSPLRFFPIILLLTLLAEFVGDKLLELRGGSNIIVYNIYHVLYFVFFLWVYQRMIRRSRHKTLIQFLIVIFVLTSVANWLFVDAMEHALLSMYVVGGISLIVCTMLYFINLVNGDIIVVLKHDLLFWISTGLILFFVGYIPIKLYRYFYSSTKDLYLILRGVQMILLFAMYGCFILGFLWGKKNS